MPLKPYDPEGLSALNDKLQHVGPAQHSMKRRSAHNDYTGRQMYMVTLVVEDRRPLLGHLAGDIHVPHGGADAPRLEPSLLGRAVSRCWDLISHYHPEIKPVALQLMPDHLHGILFVRQQMEKPLGAAINGFRRGCTRAYREIMEGREPSILAEAQEEERAQEGGATGEGGSLYDGVVRHLTQPHSESQNPPRDLSAVTHHHPERTTGKGQLFEIGYNDRILLEAGQLDRWIHYLNDNPRRLMAKRQHPDLFRVQRRLTYAGMTFSAIGNRWLLTRPKLRIQCSRRLTDDQIAADMAFALDKARLGRVLVSPRISPGEKAIIDAAFDEHLPIIVLVENGFTDLAKPGGRYFDACAEGRLLLLAPWDHHNEAKTIRRSQCVALNEMALRLCQGEMPSQENTHEKT